MDTTSIPTNHLNFYYSCIIEISLSATFFTTLAIVKILDYIIDVN